MAIRNDIWIREQAEAGMIVPFSPELIREIKEEREAIGFSREGLKTSSVVTLHHKYISYGCSSYGYDIRLSDKDFRIFHIPFGFRIRAILAWLLQLVGLPQISDRVRPPDIDPKNFDERFLKRVKLRHDKNGVYFLVPGNTYWLGVAMEHLKVPPNVTVDCKGKSTYARVANIAAPTPAEAGWEGKLTLEGHNGAPWPARMYAGEGVVQLLFHEGEPCEVTYDQRNGKYMHQAEEVTIAKA